MTWNKSGNNSFLKLLGTFVDSIEKFEMYRKSQKKKTQLNWGIPRNLATTKQCLNSRCVNHYETKHCLNTHCPSFHKPSLLYPYYLMSETTRKTRMPHSLPQTVSIKETEERGISWRRLYEVDRIRRIPAAAQVGSRTIGNAANSSAGSLITSLFDIGATQPLLSVCSVCGGYSILVGIIFIMP